jgi:hypothetical protein
MLVTLRQGQLQGKIKDLPEAEAMEHISGGTF